MRFSFRSRRALFWLTLFLAFTIAIAAASQDRNANARPKKIGLGYGLGNGLIISGASVHRIIHFTFDDGPDPELTPRLLDMLDTVSVKATFFFSASRFRGRGKRNRRAADIARDALRRGHTIGSHSVDHKRMYLMDRETIRKQLDESEALFQRVFGQRTWLFRPPHGSRSRIVDAMLAKRGYTTVLWNIGMADWLLNSEDSVLRTWRRVLARLEREKGQRGGVVLLHDTHASSVNAFELIHADIMKRNCRLLENGEELFDIVDDLRLFHVERGHAQPGVFSPVVSLKRSILLQRQSRLRKETRTRCARTNNPQSILDSSLYATDGVSSGYSGNT
jgi:peptidoglycan/xylan/chitin deacetylase (PgdA/CDA1 family)